MDGNAGLLVGPPLWSRQKYLTIRKISKIMCWFVVIGLKKYEQASAFLSPA